MWKLLNQSTSNDLIIQFNQRHRLKIQAIRKKSSQAFQTLYENSFSVKVPKLWNYIRYDLTGIKTLDDFKFKLTKFLLLIPDKPPIRSYTSPNSTPYWHGIKTEKLQVSGVVGASDGLLNLNETFQRYQR